MAWVTVMTLFGHGIECAQDIEALATGGRPDPDPSQAPQPRHEGAEDKGSLQPVRSVLDMSLGARTD